MSGGDYNGALKVASDHLGPLAASNQALMKPLKETLVALLQPSEDALIKAVPLPVLATSLQVFSPTLIYCFDASYSKATHLSLLALCLRLRN